MTSDPLAQVVQLNETLRTLLTANARVELALLNCARDEAPGAYAALLAAQDERMAALTTHLDAISAVAL